MSLSRKKKYIIAALVILVVASISTLSLFSSLTYLEWLATEIPRNGPITAYGATQRTPSALSQEITSHVFGPNVWLKVAGQLTRFFIWSDTQSTVVLGLQLSSVTVPDNWHHKQHGPVHIFWQDTNPVPPIVSKKVFLKKSLSLLPQLKKYRSAIQTSATFTSQKGSTVSNNHDLKVRVSIKPGRIRATYAVNKERSQHQEIPERIRNKDQLHISLYREVLPIVLPPMSRAHLSTIVESAFGLTKGRTEILGTIESADQFFISGNLEEDQTDNVLVGIIGNPNIFSDQLLARVREELAYNHPETSTFRLPDGTIGRELVPGSIESIEIAPFNNRGCQPIQINQREFWHCRGNDWAAITFNPDQVGDIINTIRNHQDQTWEISISDQEILKNNSITINRLQAIGDQQSGVAEITTK